MMRITLICVNIRIENLLLIFGFAALLLGERLPAETKSARPRAIATEIGTLPEWAKIFEDSRWDKAGVNVLQLLSPSNVTYSSPERTRVRLLWCKESLLIRFDCNDESIIHLPESLTGQHQRDLPYFKGDCTEVFLDPVGDYKMYMEFQFSSDNGVFDAIYFCTGSPASQDNLLLSDAVAANNLFCLKEWNLEGLRSSARIWPKSKGKGWSVIASFPAAQILHRWGKTEFAVGMELKLNLVRFNYNVQGGPIEITNWAPVLFGCAHISPAGMGTIILGPGN